MKNGKKLAILGLILFVGGSVATFGQNYKITQSTSFGGQEMTSTVYVKGSRKRTENSGIMGMGGDVASIEQCDLKRTVQVSSTKKLYFINPFATEEPVTEKPARPASSSEKTTSEKAVKGGTITMTSVITDTGERKPMFGHTARRIKTSMTSRSSPDACSRNDMSVETDGWYVDLPLFSCPVELPRNPMGGPEPKRECTDRMVVRSSGGGKLGFPLEFTQTIRTGGGSDSFTQTLSTIEFTKAVLDDALFDIPAGFALAKSSQDLYGQPDFSAMMRSQMENEENGAIQTSPTKTSSGSMDSAAKKKGIIRIGVLPPTNRGGETISLSDMQSFLAAKLTSGNFEGVAIGSEAAAGSAECDFVLSSDFSKLKQSAAGKIGGMFGKVTNTAIGGNFDAQVDFKLVSLKTGQTAMQNKAASKTDTDVNRAAETVLSMAAKTVLEAVMKQAP